MRRVVLALMLARALAPGLAVADDGRVAVPITQTTLPDGDIRYSVPVTVGGGTSLPALLDTGSTGLRVIQSALPVGSYTDTGFESLSSFASGDKLSGTVGTASVGVGGVSAGDALPIQLVNGVGCLGFRPDCGAASLPLSEYGIGGDGISGQGFAAILGGSLQPDGGAGYAENPLAHIGAGQWIVELPEPGQAGPGILILNPDADDLAGFTMFSLSAVAASGGLGVGYVDALPGCLSDASSGAKLCGPVILDTGSPGMIAFAPGVVGGPLWSAGDRASLSFGDGAERVDFAVDGMIGTGVLGQPAAGHETSLVAGVLPFFDFDVLYDAAGGRIGLKARADAPGGQSVASGAGAGSSIEVIQMNAPHAGAPALPVVITPGD